MLLVVGPWDGAGEYRLFEGTLGRDGAFCNAAYGLLRSGATSSAAAVGACTGGDIIGEPCRTLWGGA